MRPAVTGATLGPRRTIVSFDFFELELADQTPTVTIRINPQFNGADSFVGTVVEIGPSFARYKFSFHLLLLLLLVSVHGMNIDYFEAKASRRVQIY